MSQQHLPVRPDQTFTTDADEGEKKNLGKPFLLIRHGYALAQKSWELQGLPWPALVLTGVYLVFLIARLDRIVAGLNWVADAAWAPALIERQREGFGGGMTYVGSAAHFSTLAFLWITRSLPFRRELWELAPMLLTLIGAVLLGWVVWRLAGRWAAALTFCIITAASPAVLSTTLPEGMRSHTWFAMVIMACVLVLMVERADRIFSPRPLFLAAFASLSAGVTLGSDPLFLGCALLPFVLAGTTPWLVDRSTKHLRLAVAVLGVAGGAAAVAGGMEAWASALGFRKTHPIFGFTFATLDQMFGSTRLIVEDVLLLFNGYFAGSAVTARSLLQLGLAPANLAVVALPLLMAVGCIRRIRSGDAPLTPLAVFLMFWASVEIVTSAQFLISSLTPGSGVTTVRYLVPLFYAAAATLPLWAVESRWRRLSGLGWVSAFCFLSTAALLGYPRQPPLHLYDYESAQIVRAAPGIVSFLEEEDVTHGYSSYWHSHSLTYHSEATILLSPVIPCPKEPDELCRFWVNTRSDWYSGGQKRTFLVIDSGRPIHPGFEFSSVKAAPRSLGTPSAVRDFPGYSVYVYDYDIGPKIQQFQI